MCSGITSRYNGNVITVASSSTSAALLDESQYETNRGPCLQAMETGVAVLSRDMASETRWPQLEAALTSRTVIDQALGIIMGQQRCTSGDAFALLRAQSQNSQRKLRDISADLVREISGEDPQTGRPFDPS